MHPLNKSIDFCQTTVPTPHYFSGNVLPALFTLINITQRIPQILFHQITPEIVATDNIHPITANCSAFSEMITHTAFKHTHLSTHIYTEP